MLPAHGRLKGIVDPAEILVFILNDLPAARLAIKASYNVLVADVVAQSTTQREEEVILVG